MTPTAPASRPGTSMVTVTATGTPIPLSRPVHSRRDMWTMTRIASSKCTVRRQNIRPLLPPLPVVEKYNRPHASRLSGQDACIPFDRPPEREGAILTDLLVREVFPAHVLRGPLQVVSFFSLFFVRIWSMNELVSSSQQSLLRLFIDCAESRNSKSPVPAVTRDTSRTSHICIRFTGLSGLWAELPNTPLRMKYEQQAISGLKGVTLR